MKWRLGLDLGTNSIGWSVYTLNADNVPETLEDMGVRIFSDGRNPKSKEPLALERRMARGQRRIIHRRKQRRRMVFRLLQKEELFPLTREEAQPLKMMNPYELRIKALDEKLEPFELGRVLFHLSVRRGFKSNRKDGSREEPAENTRSEKLTQKDKCDRLRKAVSDSGCRTLAEFLWKHQEEHKGIRFVPGRMDYYPLRQLYIDEFNAIREHQRQFYPNVDWEAIEHALFDQRPLRPQERGACQYLPDKKRTFKAMPCAQKVRILQDVYNLAIIKDGKSCELLPEWHEELIRLLNEKEKVTFKEMRKKLSLDEGVMFNLEKTREYLKGNATAAKLRKEKCFGTKWDSIPLEEQDAIVETLITADEDSQVKEVLRAYGLSDEQQDAIASIVLPSGTTSLCKEASEQIAAKIEAEKCTYTDALKKLGFHELDQNVDQSDLLPYYGKVLVGSTMGSKENPRNDEERYGKISNPTVHIALNQTRTVVNALIRQYGKPTQIVVELSRDLKASREAKDAMAKKQSQNQKENERLNKNILDAYPGISYPNRNDRRKFRLWEELGEDTMTRKCIYCGKVISATDLFTKNIEIEHILPFGRTLCDAESNLTLAHATCNAFKKERSPFEAFGSSPAGYDWNRILSRANRLKNPAKRSRFAENAMEQFEKDSGFISRQLTDNAYLSRMALKYLHAVCRDIWAVSGGMTKLLRDKWNIDSILKRKIGDEEIAHFGLKDEDIGKYKKNRSDHRHHALDATVIALIDRSLVKKISDLNQIHQKNRIEVPPMPIPREELAGMTRNVTVSFKPDHGAQGKLSKETLLGKIRRAEQVPISEIKTEEDIARLRNETVRMAFEAKYKECKDIKKAQKVVKDLYPSVWMYKDYFVSRVPVVSLGEKNIDDVVDEKIRSKLKDFAEKHKGEKWESVMQLFSETEWQGKPSAGGKPGKKYRIVKVRCINRVQTPIEITSGSVPRYLCPEDYLAAIVWELPLKKDGARPTYQATFIRRDEIGTDGKPKNPAKPHPAAKKLCIVYKNDYLEFSDNGRWYKCRVAGYAATSNKFDIRPIYAVTDCKDWLISTNDTMTEPCWKGQKGQNFISVNVLFSEKQARPITVNPIGRVFRKK